MRALGIFCACWLLGACVPTPMPPPPPPTMDGGLCAADAGDAGLCRDPVVGRPCGPANFCPCGYLCFMDKCEVADFHPPCADMK